MAVETANAITILYTNTKLMVISLSSDIYLFKITSGVLQGDALAPYLFVIYHGYVLIVSLDSQKQLGFTLSKVRSRRCPDP